jgi:hypothetical protein
MVKKKPPVMPILVKHCALAIYRSGDIKGTILQKVHQALLIARARLTEYGFLSKGSEKGGIETIKLTGKGLRREAYHQREKGGVEKTALWDQLYQLLEGASPEELLREGEDIPGAPSNESAAPKPVAVDPRDVREAQRRHRLAKAAKAAPRRRSKRTRKPKVHKAKTAKRTKKRRG